VGVTDVFILKEKDPSSKKTLSPIFERLLTLSTGEIGSSRPGSTLGGTTAVRVRYKTKKIQKITVIVVVTASVTNFGGLGFPILFIN
jgi:hypothetical protein